MRLLNLVLGITLFLGDVFGATFTNPIRDENGSDPFMVYNGGNYYLTTTEWTNVQITRAKVRLALLLSPLASLLI